MTGRFEAGVMLTATVKGRDEAFNLTYLDHHGQTLTIPAVDAAIGETIRLRVRARDVSLATHPPTGISIRNILKGTVMEVREEADTAFAETLIDIGGGRLRARVTRHAVADLNLAEGMPVHALIKSITFDRRSLG
jgi:molybdate transport system ATP-binding protein